MRRTSQSDLPLCNRNINYALGYVDSDLMMSISMTDLCIQIGWIDDAKAVTSRLHEV
mgnify:CR=1 FL=1